jgi:hypothetical protein
MLGMNSVARNLCLAVLWGAGITAFGVLMFFAVPNRNTYIAAPGVLVAWIINGGAHGSGLGKGFVFWFWIVAVGINMLVYSVAAWLCMTVFLSLRRRRDVTSR